MGAANVEVKDEFTLTENELSKYDVVVFLNVESEETLKEDEQRALQNFLSSGKGVLVIGQQDRGRPLSREAFFANSVTLPYGIEFATGNADNTPDIAEHSITRGLKVVPGGGSVLKITSPAIALAPADGENCVLAVSQFGEGRIVAISDDSTFADHHLDGSRGKDSDNNRKLFKNILNWLLNQETDAE